MKKTILALAILLPCILATLHSGELQGVIPPGFGTYLPPFYNVIDSDGNLHSGVVIGDDKFSVTFPFDGGPGYIRNGDLIVPR